MRKSTIFISAVLTTFALAMLYGLVSTVRNVTPVSEVSALTVETATLEPTLKPTATPVMISPEQAAQLAAGIVGNTNLLSAESSTFNGLDAYLITFTNQDVVYVGLDGQILAVQVAPVVLNAAPPVVKVKHSSNNGDDSESHDDHEDDDHEDREDHDEHEEEDD